MPDITIPSKDGGSFSAYCAMPATLPAPAIIVIQEIFGVNAEMRAKCDALAAQGYIAVCPDLFWRIEPGIQLTDKTEAEMQKAFDLLNRFSVNKGVEDLRATYHTFKGHAQSTGQVGCVGYCLGGKLAYLMACRAKTDCAVSYYGIGIDEMLVESASIQKPLLMHMAENDKFVSGTAQKKIKDYLANNDLVALHSYAGVDHAFARGNGTHYDEKAATLANARTMEFFRSQLKPALAA